MKPQPPEAPAQQPVLVGRVAWQQALRDGLREPGAGFWMYSERYEDWPLDEPEVVQGLRAWALARRRSCVRMLARSYRDFPRDFPRFSRWRLECGYVVECRELPPAIEAPPEGLWLRGERAVLALPAQGQRRSLVLRGARWQVSSEPFEQAWDLAEPGFAPDVLGL